MAAISTCDRLRTSRMLCLRATSLITSLPLFRNLWLTRCAHFSWRTPFEISEAIPGHHQSILPSCAQSGRWRGRCTVIRVGLFLQRHGEHCRSPSAFRLPRWHAVQRQQDAPDRFRTGFHRGLRRAARLSECPWSMSLGRGTDVLGGSAGP